MCHSEITMRVLYMLPVITFFAGGFLAVALAQK